MLNYFKVGFQEHLRDFKHRNNRSKFAQHLLENKQGIGPMGKKCTSYT
jgi:hypothetical protein